MLQKLKTWKNPFLCSSAYDFLGLFCNDELSTRSSSSQAIPLSRFEDLPFTWILPCKVKVKSESTCDEEDKYEWKESKESNSFLQ